MMKIALLALAVIIAGVAYLSYLDAGCGPLGGAMTWGGKVCFDDLTNTGAR